MSFHTVPLEYALRALDATPGDMIRVKVQSSLDPNRFSRVEWERDIVDIYIRGAIALAWNHNEPGGYHLRMTTSAERNFFAALNNPTPPLGGGSEETPASDDDEQSAA
ncbi:hypothetical protein E1091_11850 [Micromonospora fluostatini]|uniref:Uncharacterized protein n=1 Tax=Micromonospora fluostatini TaxID=1629071 RepID=A0ABY2DGB4_9ACTN|nr:hypothetical protein E1091_11850 [Micromonospora fluostatini]